MNTVFIPVFARILKLIQRQILEVAKKFNSEIKVTFPPVPT